LTEEILRVDVLKLYQGGHASEEMPVQKVLRQRQKLELMIKIWRRRWQHHHKNLNLNFLFVRSNLLADVIALSGQKWCLN